MKWSGDNIIYLKNKSKKFSKHLERLNNIKREVINNHGRFRQRIGQVYHKDRFNG